MSLHFHDTYTIDEHPFRRLSTTSNGTLPYGSSVDSHMNFSRIGFLVIVVFWGTCNTNGWVNTSNNTKENIPYGYRPSRLIAAPAASAGSGYNASIYFNPEGTVEVIGNCHSFIHGYCVYHTDDPLLI